MKFSDAIKNILSFTSAPMTLHEIRDQVKRKYPKFYGTPSQLKNVERDYYQNIDHALVAQIYTIVKHSDDFLCDESTRSMKISLRAFDKPLHRSRLSSESAPVRKVSHQGKSHTRKR
jgi:hypothetical protein